MSGNTSSGARHRVETACGRHLEFLYRLLFNVQDLVSSIKASVREGRYSTCGDIVPMFASGRLKRHDSSGAFEQAILPQSVFTAALDVSSDLVFRAA